MSDARLAQLERIAEEAAAMAVRREVLKVSRAARQYVGNQEAWTAWLAQFYAREHQRVLRERLHMTSASAAAYCQRHREDVLRRGLRVLSEWERDAPGELLAAAMRD